MMRVAAAICIVVFTGCFTARQRGPITGWAREGDTLQERVYYYDSATLAVSAKEYNRFTRSGREAVQGNERDCKDYYEPLARSDIATGKPRILAASGPIEEDSLSDALFEARYHVRIHETGCFILDDRQCLCRYNYQVFHHLDSAYGHAWRKQIDAHHHVLGLDNYMVKERTKAKKLAKETKRQARRPRD